MVLKSRLSSRHTYISLNIIRMCSTSITQYHPVHRLILYIYRQYADFKKTSKQKDSSAALKDSKQDLQQAAAGKNIQFTETMANAYQVE